MRRTLVLAVATVTLGVLTACSEPESATGPSSSTEDTRGAACAGLDLLACARLGTLAGLVPDAPTAATGEPIRLGMVNQENTPVGSFPELSAAAQAAATFVNEQLGGVAGRPIEIDVCNTNFSAEGSTACGQQFAEAGVPAVLGGIDIFGNAVIAFLKRCVPVKGAPVQPPHPLSPHHEGPPGDVTDIP